MKSFLKNLFGKNEENWAIEPVTQFGRHSDFYKSKDKYTDWDSSLDCHNKKNYLECIKLFLSYITNDNEDNVQIEIVNAEKIRFFIYQGSKRIEGFANQDGFFAESKIAKCSKISLGALRSLLEENYHLRYSSYALDSEDNLTIVMHTDYLDASPYKLYYGLKEIATRSDRRDDVMLKKFIDLEAINNGYVTQISNTEKQLKYEFLKKEIGLTIDGIKQDNESLKEHPGLKSYRILATALVLDYFLKPEGQTMEYIENIHKIFFHSNTLSPDQKNSDMIKELQKINALEYEDIMSELYCTKSTFGVLVPGNHLRLQELIDQDMKHFDWYINNGYMSYAAYIPQYIAGILLYTYAMPLPDKNLLHLLLRVWHNDFFIQLGYQSLMKNGHLDKEYIIQLIKKGINDTSSMYETTHPELDVIMYDDLYVFSKTYLQFMYYISTKKKD